MLVQPIRDKKKLEMLKGELKKKNYRDYMFFKVGINTGLRSSDIAKLKVNMVRNEFGIMRDYILLFEQKTGKRKIFKLNYEIKQELEEFTNGMAQDEYIFKSRKGGNSPLSTVQVWRIITECAEKCGLDNIGTHTMRKTFGYWHYRQYKDVATLQVILNHTSPRETLIYIGIEQDEIDEQYVNFSL